MATTSIRTLRAELARAVRRASEGETTIVTVAGHPRAQLAPLDDRSPDLVGMIAAGAVVPPRRTTAWRPPPPVPLPPGSRLDRATAEVR